ncbi:MAG: sodium:solute symporter, partial [Deltaproteobacteria bacterium]|nr:sodium:solute symporter [Deltaproteobacteria bacterium]
MENSPLATVDIVIIVGFLVLVTIVGYAMSRVASNGIDDYFLGGNKIPWWVLGISTSTSNFDMAGTMIIVAVVFSLGYKGFLVEIRGGVGLSLAFLLVSVGKWLRRSRVMTSAEWMKLRFGTDRPGRTAHLLSAIANIVLSVGMIIYFSKGAGKFLTHFMPVSEFYATAGMVSIGLFYTLMSGLYGVVFTDVIQMILLTFTAIFVTVTAFDMTPDVTFPEGFLSLDLENPGTTGQALLGQDPTTWEPIFAVFGICVFLWVVRSSLEGMGGVGGYTDQRFFAARSEREASLLTLEAIVLSVFRWTMVAGLVVMGFHLISTGGPGADIIAEDPEQVLPVVLGQMLPAGVRGIVIAGLIAAAMSTFDSTLNAGAAYIVKDVYQSYLNPEATSKQLIRVSHAATVGLCVVGVGLAAVVPDINKIWGLITMGLGGGLFVPLFLRWYWPRFNGYGFAAGTGAGIVAALIFNAALGWPLYYSFPTILGTAFVSSIVVTLMTAAPDEETLVQFFEQVNPWGLWGPVARRAVELGRMTEEGLLERTWERITDGISLFFSVPFQVSLLLG